MPLRLFNAGTWSKVTGFMYNIAFSDFIRLKCELEKLSRLDIKSIQCLFHVQMRYAVNILHQSCLFRERDHRPCNDIT